jgi:RNA polymerase sigma-32 factor
MTQIDDFDTQRANQNFIKHSMRAPLLDGAREQKLAQNWRKHRDEAALHELVSAYARMVVPYAMKYRRYGLPMGDLIQEGNLGLMEAATRFDPERGVRFSTYATWWVRARMQDFILRNWSIVRIGTTAAQKSLFFNLRRLQARIGAAVDGRLSPGGQLQIARTLNVRVSDVVEMESRLSRADQSLNQPMSEERDTEWQELLSDSRPDPEDAAIADDEARWRSKWLAAALAELSPRERLIVRQRHYDDSGSTLEAIGKRLGVSKERVRQIEERALAKLRTSLLRHPDAGRALLPS